MNQNKDSKWESHDGILLQAIPYLGNRRILKVFTAEAGLLTLMSRLKNSALTSPFCRAEWIIAASPKGEIHALKDASLIDPFLELRKSYPAILAAGKIASDLLKSQWPRKNAKSLYELAVACLQQIPRKPAAIAESFRLKLLQLEGLLHLQPRCAQCENEASGLMLGESICRNHGAHLSFENQEWQQMLILGLSRRFSEIESLELLSTLREKSERLWLERLRQ